MNRLQLYYIDDSYIDYLRTYDQRVPFNKNKARPYVGVVYLIDGIHYFAPLSSPKPKHLKLNSKSWDIWKIDDGKLGIININNMIPCPVNVIEEALPLVSDEKYRMLLNDQIDYINLKRKELLARIRFFMTQYQKGLLPENLLQRTCDFSLLEVKCHDYIIANGRQLKIDLLFKEKSERAIFIDNLNDLKNYRTEEVETGLIIKTANDELIFTVGEKEEMHFLAITYYNSENLFNIISQIDDVDYLVANGNQFISRKEYLKAHK